MDESELQAIEEYLNKIEQRNEFDYPGIKSAVEREHKLIAALREAWAERDQFAREWKIANKLNSEMEDNLACASQEVINAVNYKKAETKALEKLAGILCLTIKQQRDEACPLDIREIVHSPSRGLPELNFCDYNTGQPPGIKCTGNPKECWLKWAWEKDVRY